MESRSPALMRHILLSFFALVFSEAMATDWKWAGFEVVGQRNIAKEEIVKRIPIKLGEKYEEDLQEWQRTCSKIKETFSLVFAGCSAVRYSDFNAYFTVEIVELGDEYRIRYRPEPTAGIPLLKQIRDALDEEKYPLFVSEGTSEQKRGRIMRSEYLGKGLRSFQNAEGTLFVYGLSFSDNDNHILHAIRKSKINRLCVSIYRDPTLSKSQAIVKKLQPMARSRNETKPLVVEFYDAESANVWA